MATYYVYFIQEFYPTGTGPIKIGRCHGDPALRLMELQVGNPRKLSLLGTVAFSQDTTSEARKYNHYRQACEHEKCMHRRFLKNHLRGEWFIWSSELEEVARGQAKA